MNQPLDDLEPIRLVTEDLDLKGSVRTQGQRMTDILQHAEPFSFLPAGANQAWTEVLPDELVFVVPPPHVSQPTLRLPRNQHAMLLSAGGYRIAGTAHLRPGELDDPILRATRRFLPLTNVTFRRGDEPDETAEVVIVNLRRVDEFNPL
ncbi:MAG: hypothetical protein M3P32_06645 [Chloroflexota bacterium]|nr:hypothetical protein [Chloroflexota bacterium]